MQNLILSYFKREFIETRLVSWLWLIVAVYSIVTMVQLSNVWLEYGRYEYMVGGAVYDRLAKKLCTIDRQHIYCYDELNRRVQVN